MGQTNWWALRQQGSKAIQLQVMNVFIQQDTRGAVHQRIERMYFTQVPPGCSVSGFNWTMFQNNLSLPAKRFHNMNVYPASQCHKGTERAGFSEPISNGKGSVCDGSEDYSTFSHFDVETLCIAREALIYEPLSRKLNNGFQRVVGATLWLIPALINLVCL
ncbi:hypothetical protein I5769_27905 [Klebsiella pneumoniae]|nr:hypothetical protein [Klebsiella pneumoniae]